MEKIIHVDVAQGKTIEFSSVDERNAFFAEKYQDEVVPTVEAQAADVVKELEAVILKANEILNLLKNGK